MMQKPGKSLGVAPPEYIIVFLLIAILAILGLVTWLGDGQRFFLNFYFLPVVIAGYTLGVRGGVMASVASVSIVVLFYQLVPPERIPTGQQATEFWAAAPWGVGTWDSGGWWQERRHEKGAPSDTQAIEN